MTRYLVAGGCGFIGSHVVKRLLSLPETKIVQVFDNFSSGSTLLLGRSVEDHRVEIVTGDLKDAPATHAAVADIDHVFHFAANPDIAKAMTDPTIDFWDGTLLTQNLIEGMRQHGVKRLTYASGSGVYGAASDALPSEDFGPLEPVSPYGASKLACEAMISAYCHMFGLEASCFRFANVVGDGQTHGVVYDFVRKFRATPQGIEILGDGSQEKSYILVDDVVEAMFAATPGLVEPFSVFNVGTGDYITVRQIAEIVRAEMGLASAELSFGDENRGWKGDVPVVKFNDAKIRSLGWSNSVSTEAAIRRSIAANISETEPA